MSRFLLLNFEDFSLKQDMTKTIQPFNPFCICCLDRYGPMFDLENCKHSDYLEAYSKPELKQFNQLVCLQCHSILKKIKCFQAQVIASYNILLSGEFTDTIVNSKKQGNLILQKVVDDLHLPPDIVSEDSIDENIKNSQEESSNVQNGPNIDQMFTHNTTNVEHDNLNMEQNFTHNMHNVVQNESNMEQNFTHNMADVEQDNSNIEKKTAHMANVVQDNSNKDQNYTQNMDIAQDPNMEPYTNEENLIQEQSRLNKNIKTALEILERNNLSFVSLGSQLQFLNGEHLSFLETSLLSKEILSDIPLVPVKSMSTDLENGLINNPKSLEIEIDGTENFYDNLDLSDLMGKETNTSEMIEEANTKIQIEVEPKTKSTATKSKKETKVQKPNLLPQMIKRITLSHEELDRERVIQAQSKGYLRYKFRCETCIVGFNYKENLEDHNKRKHGVREGDGVICEICSQVVPTAGSVTEHNYRHYTRYECVRCDTRYHTRDQAMQHYAKHQCFNGVKTKRACKTKPTVQIKRAKLKMKPS